MTTNRQGDVVTAFKAGDIDPAQFGHLDHVRVAYELLSRQDFFAAASDYASGIRLIAGKAGVPEKFNATITLAYLSLIAERMGASVDADWKDFVACNPDLLTMEALGKFYSRDRLQSDLARSRFLLPDGGDRSESTES